MNYEQLSDRQREEWVGFHIRWMRTWKHVRRVAWTGGVIGALIFGFVIFWATTHLPSEWWFYLLAIIPLWATIACWRSARSNTSLIAREQAALDALAHAGQPHQQQVEVRTFALADYDAERERAIQDAFRTGRIIIGRARASEDDEDSAPSA